MSKLDFRKVDKALYAAPKEGWARVTVPPMQFLAVEGKGDPNGPGYGAALQALYPMAYGVKFAMKAAGRDFAVPPLEALWWADEMAAFTSGDRANWRWRAMLRVPEDCDENMLEQVRAAVLAKQAKKKDGADPDLVAAVMLVPLDEGMCLQHMHIGAYSAEPPVLAELHDAVMPREGLTFAGEHHEIYLSDPRRTAPELLKTILRQPVKPS